jgi:hypothetical protein
MSFRRPERFSLDRRKLLRGLAAVSGAAVATARSARAEIWEEGDIQCRPALQEIEPAYPVDDSLLADFINVSEALTGVKPLDRRIGSQYLDRYARHPELTKLLRTLIKSYRDIKSQSAASLENVDGKFSQSVMTDSAVAPAAEQLIYLWYVSAFFLPADHSAPSRNWIYGTPEQYDHALLTGLTCDVFHKRRSGSDLPIR